MGSPGAAGPSGPNGPTGGTGLIVNRFFVFVDTSSPNGCGTGTIFTIPDTDNTNTVYRINNDPETDGACTRRVNLPFANVAGKTILINVTDYNVSSGSLAIYPQGANQIVNNQFVYTSTTPIVPDYWAEFVSNGAGTWYLLGQD